LTRLAPATPVEVWFQDEMRAGQKNALVYQWAPRGTRPVQPQDQRYESAYLFGAVCPARGVGAAVAMPRANTEAMQHHLDAIAAHIAAGAHGLVVLDRAAWHTTAKLAVPANLTLLPQPAKSPDTNPQENVWQYLRQTYLSNRVFDTYEAIIDALCEAWRKLTADPARITSIAARQWATIGQSL
jgi:hypothetical protein